MNMTNTMLVVLMLLVSSSLLQAQENKQPVDYVDPNIGGIGQLLTATVPFVQCPHGMARLAPMTTPGITDRYLADKIYGFPAGPAMLMVSTGDITTDPAAYASDVDHDFETATPYYYAHDLLIWRVKAEFTATPQAAYYRFTFPASDHAHLAVGFGRDAEFAIAGASAIEGSQRVFGPVAKLADDTQPTRQYFYAEFSRPFAEYQTW